MNQVSLDEFAGMGPSFEQELAKQREEQGNTVMAEAMKILEAPGLHTLHPEPNKQAKVFSRIYDLSNRKDRLAYEIDVAKVMNSAPGTLLLLDRPSKQFVNDASGSRYIAYLEWAEYVDVPKSDEKSNKSLVQPKV